MEIDGSLSWVGAAIAEAPMLERLIMASLELALLAPVVFLFDRLLLRRRPRVVALLWTAVIGNAVLSSAFDAPLSFALLRLPIPQQAVPADSGGPELDSRLLGEVEGSGALDDALHEAGPSYRAPSLGQVAYWRAIFSGPAQAVRARPGATLLNAWLLGVGTLALVALRDRLRLWRLLHKASVAGAAVQRELHTLAGELGIRRVPRLAICPSLDSPAIAGAVRPVILVPEWLLTSANSPRLRWALRHELMHAKMADPMVNALSQLMRILFFFHPAARWAARRWKEAMELACDHALLRSEADVRDYLDTLHAILCDIRSRRKLRLSCGLFAVRSQLGRRVAALVCMPPHATRTSPAGIGAVLCFALAALCIGGHIAPAAQANASHVWPVREVMRFPEDRSMGTLYVQPMGAVDELAWELWGEAQGAVDFPDAALARLELSRQAMKDLTPLDALGRYDLQSVVLTGRPNDWSELRHLNHLSLWELKYQPQLGYGGSSDGSRRGPVPPPNGTLQFPEERSLGYVYVGALSRWGSAENWEPWQEAQGVVAVPREGYVIRLALSNEAMNDLSPLAALDKHDLQSITFQRRPRSWEDLAYLDGLTLWELEYHATMGYGGGVPAGR
ncbi:MAG: M56 family metallopeptidase [Candidatus Hydrogenedentes bacterium]|nr:M56 family metallopeptidase [Candidatus Hydrogenedentota bacterium]